MREILSNQRATINLYHGDCMEAMAKMPDKAYELAIVDPPYGLPDRSGQGAGKLQNRIIQKMHQKGWDTAPEAEYFNELFRVSKNQIIWGGNYFNLPPSRGFLIWDKVQPWENFSACEFAWTSFDCPSKMFREATTMTGEKKIHPTQKSVALYKHCIQNYAKEGDKILDTHGGSMSIAIACWDLKFDLDLWELDADYFRAGKERFENHMRQEQFDF